MTLAHITSATHPAGGIASVRRPSSRLLWAAAFAILGLAADLAAGPMPLAFAAILILALGLPHGASDHLAAMAGRRMRDAPGRLLSFLALYLGAVAATLLLWHAAPGATLAAFLTLSAVHFAIDDVRDELRLAERVARGLMPMTLPALFHTEALTHLFAALSTPASGQGLTQAALVLSPLVLALVLLAIVLRLRDGDRASALELALSASALLAFTPLVGFALVFALVHSRGQTHERMAELHLPTLRAYLLACAPTLLGAAILFASLAVLFANDQALALSAVFIGLAALTVPHMLVTPLFGRREAPPER
ncbi:Brp/Blh family beta-carotene 15,15'-dioxygenase [Aureimonas phyllosphaerae]|uniref:Probable beta-carotene 15,15'-dioxygenase n=1 Tax=Aureimonas phyllosphaerae TaxID=1166078 RepID=A0A7W6FUT3_9HYPH|nr:Brp/Blh family beta-carotene 15,15'-dioxygenase [Aureimonas phyllosphaerae]MBB3936569.1 Brp/Blh family beta-carotene 15,15'-monooxygenase [Aureimonas phyllosphaerae]MBB3960567.1 Brp/Blh family beta-carotene 15,15'-monooxygenase [Aureimonas phyllosphaerae]SFF24724.1 beta-carotene 15,15'-monooxygenase, Brp/Blh family [Aureimonas phyllosphaerae]